MDGRQVSWSMEVAKVDNAGAGEVYYGVTVVGADSVHGVFSPSSECSTPR
jgi:hypothetical protein